MIVKRLKSKFVFKDMRFNSSFYLNEDAINSRVIEENIDKCVFLGDLSMVFNPPIFKRQFCQKTSKSIPYCQSSDVSNALDGSETYVNKVHALKVGAIVKKNQILITGFGTIGYTRIVSELSAGICYANNVCRVEPNDESFSGFLYAVLSSKYGRSQLNKNASGSVVRFIEAPGIKKILIPELTNSKKQTIHDLIIESTKLREDANKLLNKAITLLETKLPGINHKKIYSTKISDRIRNFSRLEGTFDIDSLEDFNLKAQKKGAKMLSIFDLSEQVFTPGIFKRVRTNESSKGIPFLSGSDLLKQSPSFNSFLSKKMKNINDYILKEGWIAIQDAGTIGYVSYITKYLDGVSATNNLVRIKPRKDENYNHYIFCFLKTSIGQKMLKTLEYGSVQKHIDNKQISNLLIPVFENIFTEISKEVSQAMFNFGEACFLEKKAINIIEKEIDSWQVA